VFTFSPAISFMVDCKTQEEVDEFWERLSEGGEIQQCGWLQDRYGVSWQIVPTVLGEMLQDKDAERSERVMKAMLQMKKLDIKIWSRRTSRSRWPRPRESGSEGLISGRRAEEKAGSCPEPACAAWK